MLADRAWNHGAAGVQRLFRALHTRNYRLFFGGQSISLIGTWMQQVALGWWVYRHTHSALMLSIVSGAGQISAFMLAPFAGVFSDRWDRHRLLMVTQTLAMLQALVLAGLVLGLLTSSPPSRVRIPETGLSCPRGEPMLYSFLAVGLSSPAATVPAPGTSRGILRRIR